MSTPPTSASGPRPAGSRPSEFSAGAARPAPHPAYPPLPPAAEPPPAPAGQRGALIASALVGLVIVALVITAGYYLVNNPAQASVWRDVFIIFMGLEALFVGAALTILMVQLATLTNLLKNEIKPILEATHETVNTVRGTAVFVSENLAEPIMKLNSYVAGLTKIVETLSSLGSIFRRP